MDSTTAAIAFRIRRLSGASLRALVADLWSARGRESVGRDDVSVAGRGPWSVRVRIDGTSAVGEAVFDDRGIAEMLQYAVEPAETRRLCETHLGAPPSDLPSPPVTRGKQALRGLSGRATAMRRRLEPPGSTTPVAILGVLLLVVGAVVLAGPPADPSPVSGDAPADSAVTPPDVNASDGGAVAAIDGGADRLVPMEFPADYPPSPALVEGGLGIELDGSLQEGGTDGQDGCAPSRLQRVDGGTGDALHRYSCQ